ncbi:MAG TPA: type I secretion system permease/ATPase [Piscirickettsiaceae bacterium]|nr:type I secretion system permease/ATPase [Piscirickettsiaceae bacterium]
MKHPSTAQKITSELGDLLRYLRRYFYGVGAFSFVINLLMLVPAIYMLQVYDRVLTSRNENTLFVLTALVVGLFVLMGLLEFIRSRVLVRVGAIMEHRINERVFDAAFEATLRKGVGNARQALSDLTQLRQFLTGNGPFAFFDVPWIPIYIGVIFLLHPLVGWFAVGATLVLLALAVINELTTRKPLQQANQQANQAVNFAHNNLANAEVIEAMGMQPNLRKKWREKHMKHLALQATASDRAGLITATTKVTRIMVQSLVLGLGAWLVLQDEMTAGGMIAGSILLGRALAPVEQLIANWKGFVTARGAYQRLNELLASFPRRQTHLSLPAPKGHVQVENVVAIPPGGQTPVLKGVNFVIEPGTIVGMIGPSASGKSTLARLLVGVWPPAAGKVRLDGADLFQWDKSEVGPYIGYLPQDIELFEGTIAENIARFGDLDSEKIIQAAKRAGVHEMILRFPKGYETPIGPGGANLSGGQRQRIALARAMYGDARLLVLDEPNANLDEAGEAALIQALRTLKQEGRTVVVITHKMNLLNGVDNLMVLRDGMMQAYGPKEQILAQMAKAKQQAQQQAGQGQTASKQQTHKAPQTQTVPIKPQKS